MPSYAVITPARNEGSHFHQTISSVIAQTLRPLAWVIVDDGSTDITPQLADAAASRYSWIWVVHRSDRGYRKQGGGVIEAFYDGFPKLATLNQFATPALQHSSTLALQDSTPSWDFLVKLDGDLSFAPTYFEQCLARFAQDPRLGIGGGRVYCQINGAAVEDSPGDPSFHVRGATKIYRRACWDAIGGLLPGPGWDTIDEIKANMLGWLTYTFTDIKLLQLKPTGTADGSWKNWVKNGLANYNTGYHPLFMVGKCLRRFVDSPFSLAAPGLLAGFLGGYLKGKRAEQDKKFIRYVRRQQMNRLLLRDSLWKAPGQAGPAPPLASSAQAHAGR